MHNLRHFEEALKGYLRKFNKLGAMLGLLILDLDQLKSFNDNYGHDVGDLVLKELALRMRAISREHELVARLGGEEFAVITPFANHEQLLGVADRSRKIVEALNIKTENVAIRPTVSIGVATNQGGADNIDDIFNAADRKLYTAKNKGRNRVAA
jgi:two-component system, cell cycle response regulator